MDHTVFDILGEQDYNKLTRLLSYLDYESIENFWDLNSAESANYLDNHSLLSQTTYNKRYKKFFSDGTRYPILRSMWLSNKRQYILKNENYLFNKLEFGFLRLEFSDPDTPIGDLDIRFKEISSFYNYCIGVEGNNYSRRLDYLTNLFDKRKLQEKKSAALIPRKPGVIFKELVNHEELYLIASLLVKHDFISSEEHFLRLFFRTEVNSFYKVNWKKDLVSCIFLFKVLSAINAIKYAKQSGKLISSCFLRKGKEFDNGLINTLSSDYDISGISRNNLSEFIENTNNEDIRKIYELMQKAGFRL